ncbi:MAG: translation initiation factor IF-2 subunit beta [Candidatus Altiarchaeota archaeon]|nr:translation initiation factor IF-2 subunit beta [Candidatus Altiarchaeota archaeon]
MAGYDYEKLLDRAWGMLPDKLKSHERFEIPQAVTFVEGQTTIIKNFNEIASMFNMQPSHLMKFLSKELAAPGNIEPNRVIIQRVLRKSVIDAKIKDYAEEFVLCSQCKRPDTKFDEMNNQGIIKCDACGGWRPLRRIK